MHNPPSPHTQTRTEVQIKMLLAEASRVESTMEGALERLQRLEEDGIAAPETNEDRIDENTHTHT